MPGAEHVNWCTGQIKYFGNLPLPSQDDRKHLVTVRIAGVAPSYNKCEDGREGVMGRCPRRQKERSLPAAESNNLNRGSGALTFLGGFVLLIGAHMVYHAHGSVSCRSQEFAFSEHSWELPAHVDDLALTVHYSSVSTTLRP